MTTRVFILEPIRKDIDLGTAFNFGDIEYLVDSTVHRCSAFDTDGYQRFLTRRLDKVKYDPERDIICIVGSMVLVSTLLVVIAQRCESFRVLMYSSTDCAYIERRLGRPQNEGERKEAVTASRAV